MLYSFLVNILSVNPTRGDGLSKRNVVRQLYFDHKTHCEELSKKLSDLETIRCEIAEYLNKTLYNPGNTKEPQIYLNHINAIEIVCSKLTRILTDEYKNIKYLNQYTRMSQSKLEELKIQIKEEIKQIMKTLEKEESELEELIKRFRCEKIFYTQKETLFSLFNKFISAYKDTKMELGEIFTIKQLRLIVAKNLLLEETTV